MVASGVYRYIKLDTTVVLQLVKNSIICKLEKLMSLQVYLILIRLLIPININAVRCTLVTSTREIIMICRRVSHYCRHQPYNPRQSALH